MNVGTVIFPGRKPAAFVDTGGIHRHHRDAAVFVAAKAVQHHDGRAFLPRLHVIERMQHTGQCQTVRDKRYLLLHYHTPLPRGAAARSKKKPARRWLEWFGGEEGDRTLDLRIANATLSQLSYFPKRVKILSNSSQAVPACRAT